MHTFYDKTHNDIDTYINNIFKFKNDNSCIQIWLLLSYGVIYKLTDMLQLYNLQKKY